MSVKRARLDYQCAEVLPTNPRQQQTEETRMVVKDGPAERFQRCGMDG